MITAIVPTLNVAAHIGSCLESLRRQTCQDFDVCVVDGNSVDGTLDVVMALRDKLGQGLNWYSGADDGPYAAMNRGIGHARGDWLYFMGADDLLYDERVFEDLSSCLYGSEADIVYGDVIFKSSGSRYGGQWSLDRLLFEGNICHQAIFYRRKVFDRIGGFATRYPIWADWELNIRCFRHPDMKTTWIDRIIATYNDANGLSRIEDPVFRKELPVILRDSIHQIKRSRSYRYGKALFGWLDSWHE